MRLLANNQIASNSAISIFSNSVLDLNGFTNTVGEVQMSGGSVKTGAGTLKISGKLAASPDTSVTLSGSIQAGRLENSGAMRLEIGLLSSESARISGNLSIGSGATAQFGTELNVTVHGALSGSAGARFIVSGDLISDSTESVWWNTTLAEVNFSGGSGSHKFSINGLDLGATTAGYQNDFAWGALRLASGESLTLLDAGLPGGALYTGDLLLEGGIGQISSISSSGLNVYYDSSHGANAYLGSKSYPLTGGGFLIPVPEPGSAALLSTGALLLAKRRSRKRVIAPHSQTPVVSVSSL